MSQSIKILVGLDSLCLPLRLGFPEGGAVSLPQDWGSLRAKTFLCTIRFFLDSRDKTPPSVHLTILPRDVNIAVRNSR